MVCGVFSNNQFHPDFCRIETKLVIVIARQLMTIQFFTDFKLMHTYTYLHIKKLSKNPPCQKDTGVARKSPKKIENKKID